MTDADTDHSIPVGHPDTSPTPTVGRYRTGIAVAAGLMFAIGMAFVILQARFGNPLWVETPTVPFGTPVLAVWDTLRVITVVLGLLVIIFGIHMIATTKLPARWLMTAALFAWNVSAIGTEVDHLGDHATYRLFFNLIGACVACVGIFVARAEP